MSWMAVLPFAGLLACIAILPLIGKTKHAWEKTNAKLLTALVFGMPMALYSINKGYGADVAHAVVEYVQFIILLGSLFVISGGINVGGDIQATPLKNTLFLAIGGLLASFIGTTGAAMLLIRPICGTISERKYKKHTIIFAIFIIANCGGLLTPLGDPPLFLGMLRGVPFAWTFTLLPQWFLVNGLLLLSYYALDREMYAKEPRDNIVSDVKNIVPITVNGKQNFLFLAVVVMSVAFVPTPYREIVMLAAAGSSYFLTNQVIRRANNFVWEPILEVGTLFIGIFLAMVPALIYLRQIAPGLPINALSIFVFTGGLSAVLDNAPTYVTFFEIAKEFKMASPSIAGVPEALLQAISLGAVFGGAITYIGNGPNFMVKSVAESMKIDMPSFGGYVAWSFKHLVPILAMMAFIFIAKDDWANVLGVAGVLGMIAVRAWQIAKSRPPAYIRAAAGREI